MRYFPAATNRNLQQINKKLYLLKKFKPFPGGQDDMTHRTIKIRIYEPLDKITWFVFQRLVAIKNPKDDRKDIFRGKNNDILLFLLPQRISHKNSIY